MHMLNVLVALLLALVAAVGAPALAAPEPPSPEAAAEESPTPALPPEAMGRPASLRARAAALQQAAVQRRVEQQRLGEAATEEQRAAWTAASAADDAELDRIVATLANLEARPDLLEEAQAPRRSAVATLRGVLTAMPDVAGLDIQHVLARLEADDAAYEELLAWLRTRSGPLDPAVTAPPLEALGEPDTAPGAIERLDLLLPSLDEQTARTVDESLVEWAAAPNLTEPTVPLPPELAEARRGVAVWRVQAVPEGFAGAAAAAAAVAADVEATPIQAPDRDAQAEQAQAEAEASKEAADRAMDAEVRALLERVARATERRAHELSEPLFDPEAPPPPMTEAELEEVRREVSEVGTWSSWIRSIFSRTDTITPDRRYETLRSQLARLRQREVERQAVALALHAQLRDAEKVREGESAEADRAMADVESLPAETQAEITAAVGRWRAANDAWVDHIQERLDAAGPQGWVERVQQLGRVKHRLIPEVSSQVFRQYLLTDVRDEIAFIEPEVGFYGRNRRGMLSTQIRNLLRDGNALIQLINGSLFAALLAIGWGFGRSRASSIALSIARRIRQGRPDLRLSDVRALKDPLARTIRNVVDLALGPMLLINLDALPELELVIRLYLYLALYRVMLALFDLAVVPADEARPALLVLRRESFTLLRQTLRAYALTFVLVLLVDFAVGDLLGAGTVLWVTDAVLDAWLVGLTVWTLVAWEPLWRARLRRRFTATGGILRWLLPEEGGRLFTLPRALGQLVLLSAVMLAEGVQRFAQEGTAASTLYNLFNRAVLRDDAAPDRPLEPAQRSALCDGPTPAKHLVVREELQQVNAALVRWRQTGQRGLVAVVGDRGAGKHTAMNDLAERLAASGMPVTRTAMTEPVRNRKELAAWLGAAFGVSVSSPSNDDMIAAIESLEPSALLVEGLHHAFLRRVGGLSALHALLYVLNAACDRHFFVCSVHGPAWDYFDAQGSPVDCGVFQTVVRLEPMDSQQLRNITLARAGDAGLRVDFSSLRVGSLGSDRDLEADRAMNMYYRLLAEASRGNPEAAIDMFARSLVRTDDPNVVQVTLRQVLNPESLPDLGETALFALVALNLHDVLTLDDLVAVTHLPRGPLRASVRDLVSRGWVVRLADQLRLRDERRIMLQRSLRRRHFLHLGPDG